MGERSSWAQVGAVNDKIPSKMEVAPPHETLKS